MGHCPVDAGPPIPSGGPLSPARRPSTDLPSTDLPSRDSPSRDSPDVDATGVLPVGVDRDDGARVLGLLAGSGGSGGSTLAAAVAVTAAADGARVLLVDLDPLGGGIDLLLGLDDVPGLRWSGLTGSRGRLPAHGLHDALPRAGSLAVLAWDRGAPVEVPADVVDAVLDAGRRGHDLVVLDLPRCGPVLAMVAGRVGEVVMVAAAQIRAVAAAAQTMAALATPLRPGGLVVRRRAGDELTGRQVGEVLGLPVLTDLREDPRVVAAAARGQLPGLSARSALRRAARCCLDAGPLGPGAHR
jgi:secretion/DNA translocation related CpaE-like protein